MKKTLHIAGRPVGEGKPCFVIAEAGCNHNGDIHMARKLVDAAREAGADAVKFQAFKAERLVTKSARKEEYQEPGIAESQYEMLKKLELTEEAQRELFCYCQEKKIVFLSTPYDEESADFLERLGVPAFKISSSDITHLPLLRHVARKQLPVIISTGASYLDEVEEAVAAVKSAGNHNIILLHCTNIYPVSPGDVNLRAMRTLRAAFDLPVGYSDHSLGMLVSVAAVAMGAVAIEKHLTLDRRLPGPDHKASLEPQELKGLVAAIRDTEEALGSAVKKPVKGEYEDRKLGRRSVIARHDIAAGTTIARDMLTIKRPGNGIQPRDLDKIVGRQAKQDIRKDAPVTWKHLS